MIKIQIPGFLHILFFSFVVFLSVISCGDINQSAQFNNTNECANKNCVKNAYCLNGVCICEEGYKESKGQCSKTDNAQSNLNNGQGNLNNDESNQNNAYYNNNVDTDNQSENHLADTDNEENLCEDILCSNHGICSLIDSEPTCICDTGYHSEELECILDDPCLGIDCSEG